MTFTERLRLLAFGLTTWSSGMFAAVDPHAAAVVVNCAPTMAGIGVGLFVVGLLPGRMARFA